MGGHLGPRAIIFGEVRQSFGCLHPRALALAEDEGKEAREHAVLEELRNQRLIVAQEREGSGSRLLRLARWIPSEIHKCFDPAALYHQHACGYVCLTEQTEDVGGGALPSAPVCDGG